MDIRILGDEDSAKVAIERFIGARVSNRALVVYGTVGEETVAAAVLVPVTGRDVVFSNLTVGDLASTVLYEFLAATINLLAIFGIKTVEIAVTQDQTVIGDILKAYFGFRDASGEDEGGGSALIGVPLTMAQLALLARLEDHLELTIPISDLKTDIYEQAVTMTPASFYTTPLSDAAAAEVLAYAMEGLIKKYGHADVLERFAILYLRKKGREKLHRHAKKAARKAVRKMRRKLKRRVAKLDAARRIIDHPIPGVDASVPSWVDEYGLIREYPYDRYAEIERRRAAHGEVVTGMAARGDPRAIELQVEQLAAAQVAYDGAAARAIAAATAADGAVIGSHDARHKGEIFQRASRRSREALKTLKSIRRSRAFTTSTGIPADVTVEVVDDGSGDFDPLTGDQEYQWAARIEAIRLYRDTLGETIPRPIKIYPYARKPTAVLVPPGPLDPEILGRLSYAVAVNWVRYREAHKEKWYFNPITRATRRGGKGKTRKKDPDERRVSGLTRKFLRGRYEMIGSFLWHIEGVAWAMKGREYSGITSRNITIVGVLKRVTPSMPYLVMLSVLTSVRHRFLQALLKFEPIRSKQFYVFGETPPLVGKFMEFTKKPVENKDARRFLFGWLLALEHLHRNRIMHGNITNLSCAVTENFRPVLLRRTPDTGVRLLRYPVVYPVIMPYMRGLARWGVPTTTGVAVKQSDIIGNDGNAEANADDVVFPIMPKDDMVMYYDTYAVGVRSSVPPLAEFATTVHELPGITPFSSPEIVAGDKAYASSADIWSIAVVFCWMVLGRHPFIAHSSHRTSVDEYFAGAVQVGPIKRWADVPLYVGTFPALAPSVEDFVVPTVPPPPKPPSLEMYLAIAGVPAYGINLIMGMLHPDKTKRPSAMAAVHHPYFK